MFNVKEAARRLGLKAPQVVRLVNAGRLESAKQKPALGNRGRYGLRFRQANLDRFLALETNPANAMTVTEVRQTLHLLGDDQVMHLTEAGQQEFRRLMTTKLRGPMGEVNKLIVALKLHFLDQLDRDQRRQQLEMLMEVCDRELVRLNDLRSHHMDSDGALIPWLDHEIAEVQARRDWFLNLSENV